MSKYSTSIEVIVNSQSQHQYDIYERIEVGRHFIFDFEYLTPNDDFKKSFETQFIEKYWQDCIGFETVPLFKMKLKQKLEMLMPEYVFKYNALQKLVNCDPTIERSGESIEDSSNNSNAKSSTSGTGTNKSKNVTSNTPANMITANDIGNVKYADGGGMVESSNTATSNGVSESHNDGSVERRFKEFGNQLTRYSEYYMAYHNIMNDLLKELDSLFIPLLF